MCICILSANTNSDFSYNSGLHMYSYVYIYICILSAHTSLFIETRLCRGPEPEGDKSGRGSIALLDLTRGNSSNLLWKVKK